MRPPANNAPIRLVDDPAVATGLKRDLQATANWTPIAFPVGAALSKFEASIAIQDGGTATEGTTELLRGLQDVASNPVATASPTVAAASPVIVASAATTSGFVKIASLTLAGIGLAGGLSYGGVAWQQSKHQAPISATLDQDIEIQASPRIQSKEDNEQIKALPPIDSVANRSALKPTGRDSRRKASPQASLSSRSKSKSLSLKKKETSRSSSRLKMNSLSKEADMIGQARKYLSQSPSKTLRITATISKQFPNGVLVQEREGLEILALYKLDQNRRANGLAKGFLRKYPHGTMAERIRQQSQQ